VGIVVAMFTKSAESKPPPTDDLSPVNSPTDSTEIPVTSPTALPTPTAMDDWINSCDESSSSLAKRLPCVSQDETRLNLSSNSLTGTIPSEVGLLTKLTSLDLSENSLKGTIPSQIALMSNLAELYLYNNNLTGTIPSQLALMSNLSGLSLRDNSLTGTIPSEIALMSNLSGLYLNNNSLTGMIPSQIALMSNLDSLFLYSNNFTGEFTCPAFIDVCLI
jgi:Leucine-rich repeat (LRR) protein